MSAATGLRIAPADWSLARRAKNTAIYWLVCAALAIAAPMPHAWLVGAGRALGWLAWLGARRARRVAESNARRVLGAADLRPDDVARRSFVELGGLLGDAVTLLRPDERALARLPFAAGAQETLAALLDEGAGVVLVTAHLGAWERLAACLVEAGFALTTPVRASYDPRLEARVHAPLRTRRGVVALDRDAPGTPRALLRAMRRGGIVGFLVDLRTTVASVRVPFLGVPAWTPTAPARLALRTGAPVVVAIAGPREIELEVVRHRAPRSSGAIDDAVIALTTRLNEVLGAAVLRAPERWIWMHDRWGERSAPAATNAWTATGSG